MLNFLLLFDFSDEALSTTSKTHEVEASTLQSYVVRQLDEEVMEPQTYKEQVN